MRTQWTKLARTWKENHDKTGDKASDFQIYEILVSKASLYGKAFFGHKCQPGERKLLHYLWKVAMKTTAQ